MANNRWKNYVPVVLTEKQCRTCNTVKPVAEFYVSKDRNNAVTADCRVCSKEISRIKNKKPAMIQKNKDRGIKFRSKNKDKIREYYIKSTYGISNDEFTEMEKSQNGVCAICQNPPTRQASNSKNPPVLYVDHCHETGKIRQLLCQLCNSAIGYFRDDTSLMEKAIKYVKKHQ